jgi:hypothetical protein
VIRWGNDDSDAYIVTIAVLLPTGNGITDPRKKCSKTNSFYLVKTGVNAIRS